MRRVLLNRELGWRRDGKRAPMARCISVMALATTLGASECGFDAPPRYSLTVQTVDRRGPSIAVEVDDEVAYVAREDDIDTPGTPPTNLEKPENFGWDSSDTNVATISALGVVRGRAIGGTTITAQGLHTRITFRVLVGPKFGRIELDPDSATMSVGGSAAFHIVAYDPAGNRISSDSSKGYLRLASTSSLPGFLVTGSSDGWLFTATAAGSTKVVASVDAYHGARLRDTSIVVVR